MIEIGTTRFRLTDGVLPWPEIPEPTEQDYIEHLLLTKDSAPGPDGLPYALWRMFPQQTAAILQDDFHHILAGVLAPPTQVGVWIPKAKQGPTADFFRPLGMPDTLDRLQDGTAAAILFRITRHSFHPAQTLLNSFREPQRAVLEVQGALEGSSPASALFADLSKAFERINAHWILHILRIRQCSPWVLQFARYLLFGRRIRHKVQGRLLPARNVHSGVDMGRPTSVYSPNSLLLGVLNALKNGRLGAGWSGRVPGRLVSHFLLFVSHFFSFVSQARCLWSGSRLACLPLPFICLPLLFICLPVLFICLPGWVLVVGFPAGLSPTSFHLGSHFLSFVSHFFSFVSHFFSFVSQFFSFVSQAGYHLCNGPNQQGKNAA